jgi:hypothetical protein
MISLVNLFIFCLLLAENTLTHSLKDGGISMTENFPVELSSDFPYFLSFCVQFDRLKDVFWVFGLSQCTSINLIEKEQKAYEGHVKNKQKDNSDPMVVVNDNGCESKGAKEHDKKPDNNTIENDSGIIKSNKNKYKIEQPVPDHH